MKLSNDSQYLLSFLKEKKISLENNSKISSSTISILKYIFKELQDSHEYLLTLKNKKDSYYERKIKKINKINEIKKPRYFSQESFPKEILNHINKNVNYEILYSFILFQRKIQIFFIVEELSDVQIYDNYIDIIYIWLYILNNHASKKCASSLTIYFYFTSLKKSLPKSKNIVLNEYNANTAFTTSCPSTSEIVVFRREEWFKVFIHESFHNFGLDFSDINNRLCHERIKETFPVDSAINAYEAYTEFWAEILNVCICSFLSLSNKINKNEFINRSLILIQIERTYSFFQLVKVLDYMGLKYEDLFSKSRESILLREKLYKEKTNILAYYVLKTILLNNFQGFLFWCKQNNKGLFQFVKTKETQIKFCHFIEENYRSKQMIDNIHSIQKILFRMKNDKNKAKNHDILLSNMRMTLCELG
jgi:hypothetical protein